MSRFPDFEISHLGLHVFELEPMVSFYKDVFGFIEADRGVVNGTIPVVFLSRSARDHHQVVLAGGRTAASDALLLNQISLRVASLAELRTVFELLSEQEGASDLRAISHGNAYSVYVRDPEGNKLEVFTDSPWYVEQPVLDPFDFSLTDDEILANTLENIKDRPGFKSFSQWSADMQQRLDATI
ncbi:MAG: VOC family protein [Halioglobus sp.]